MKILTILAQKGGAGKTTLSIHLAAAANEGRVVVIGDADPQGSAAVWSRRREEPSPEVVPIDARGLKRAVKAAAKGGVDLLVIDTPPHSTKVASLAASLSDMVLIPTRPAILDLEAIGDSVTIAQKVKTPGAVALNCCPPPTRYGEAAIVREARDALAAYGMGVAPVALSQRAAFSHALIDGRSVTEFEKNGKAADEIRALWNWVEKELDA